VRCAYSDKRVMRCEVHVGREAMSDRECDKYLPHILLMRLQWVLDSVYN
jgi:hypothetical protein